MHAPRHSRKARIILAGIAAAALWIAAIMVAAGGMATRVLNVILAGAVTLTLALVVIAAALNVRDRHAALVLRVLADVTRPAVPDQAGTTLPLHVVR